MERGFIKIYRKLRDSWLYQEPICLLVFMHFLLEAEWREGRKKFVSGQQIILKPGQLTSGRKQIAVALKLSERNVRTAMDKLEKAGIIAIQTTSRFSLITLLNWDKYQKNDQPIGYEPTNGRPASDQQPTTPEELKKGKNERISAPFIQFWKSYPCRNGKRLGQQNALKLFTKLKEEDIPLILVAVKNYANSKMIRDGIGIKDPERFLKNDFWRDWIEPERYPEAQAIKTETPTRHENNEPSDRRFAFTPPAEDVARLVGETTQKMGAPR